MILSGTFTQSVTDLTWSADGQTLFASSTDGSIAVCQVNSLKFAVCSSISTCVWSKGAPKSFLTALHNVENWSHHSHRSARTAVCLCPSIRCSLKGLVRQKAIQYDAVQQTKLNLHAACRIYTSSDFTLLWLSLLQCSALTLKCYLQILQNLTWKTESVLIHTIWDGRFTHPLSCCWQRMRVLGLM